MSGSGNDMKSVLLVMTNMPDATSAENLARILVGNRIAACVNCLPGVRSIYRWEGAVEEANEITLLIKTAAERYTELETIIRQNHPYRVPEIIAIPPSTGWPPYLNWIVEETGKDLNV
jgi:periplasmic divalent cation tolerance protein